MQDKADGLGFADSTPRRWGLLALATVPLTLRLDHLRRAEQTMNGLNQQTSPQPLLNIMLRPLPTQGRNRSLEAVATNGCKRDTVRCGAVATGVATPLNGDGSCLGTVESRCARRRCLIPCRTASPDAVPQRPDCKSLLPREAFRAIPTA